jgi:phage tail sheath protein FI
VLGENQTRRSEQLENLFALRLGDAVTSASLRGAFVASEPMPAGGSGLVASVTVTFALTDGNDGLRPGVQAYADALEQLESLENISIVAAPGYSATAVASDYDGINQLLIGHAEKRRSYRIAVLDSQPDRAPSEVRATKSKIDSTYAAFYYPWVIVANPLSRPGREDIPKELALPPSGFVTGIYARTDVQRGVFKAPANETVTGAIRFQSEINFANQEVLNPLGINCLRSLPNRGNRVWGARTISSDPEWKYVNVRRYFNYIERSIDIGTQWAVFEPNGPRLWANVRDTIGSFLYNEWRNGALLGDTFKEAAFVRCDRTTMDQNDLDNGRLVCLIGLAVLKPAEFVIFRVGQKTADARS